MQRSATCLFLAAAISTRFLTVSATANEPPTIQRIKILVKETAGIRRFGYPVNARVALHSPVFLPEGLRLLDHGRPVPAQFSHPKHGKLITHTDVDFAVSFAPYEIREYVLEAGQIQPAPNHGAGLRLEENSETSHVQFGSELEFVLPSHLLGLFERVHTPKTDYLRPGSAGLLIRYKDNLQYRVGGSGPVGETTRSRAKHGPIAGAIEFRSKETARNGRPFNSEVRVEFVRSKSWAEINWQVNDPQGEVAGLGVDLNLNIQGEPTLVDFGAGTLVYTQLRKGEAATMRAGNLAPQRTADLPAWQTLTGPVGKLTPYVLAPRVPQAPRAEGWAHVMDRERCTAVAVKGFADDGQESEITIGTDGRLQICRSFAARGATPPKGHKQITFWLHFVSIPVHVGAATSPQAMLAPLEVEVVREKK